MDEYERRSERRLTDEEMAAIATRVKNEIMEDIYGEIGKAVLKRAVQVVTLAATAALAYFGGKGDWLK